MRQIDTARTVEEEAFREIRTEILGGGLEPGSRLRLRELAERLGVSSLPVRSALLRLRAEGLVVYVPHSGSIVAPLEFEELEEIQAFRVGIEGLAARLGAVRLTDGDVERMRVQLRQLEEIAREPDLGPYLAAEWSFREICFRACRRERLLAHVRDFRLRAGRYLRVAWSSPDGLAESVRFQRRFFAACSRRDGEAAEAVSREALEWTKTVVAPLFDDVSASAVSRR
jgi:DNA-binding GntR family transcriptional regulator